MNFETLFDGKQIPVIGLGTWTIGGEMSVDYSMDDKYVQLIQESIKMGYSHIDTAEMYGGGHTEELVGKAIKSFNRDDLFITSKVWSTNLRYGSVLKSLETSLEKLELDYVDLYLIHWPNPVVPLKETFKAFNEMVEKGHTKYIGVSNFSLQQLKHAQELAHTPIATNQVDYNLHVREPEKNGLLQYCQQNNILLTAYEPFGKGSVLRNPALLSIAKNYSLSPAQLALLWLIQKPKVITIPMSSNITHLKENLEVFTLNIPDDLITQLNHLSN